MSKPVTPKFHADTVTLQTLSVQFNQTWDGVSWSINPATIELQARGNLSETGTDVTPADLKIVAADLPAAGQQALQDLWTYLEGEMATKYS